MRKSLVVRSNTLTTLQGTILVSSRRVSLRTVCDGAASLVGAYLSSSCCRIPRVLCNLRWHGHTAPIQDFTGKQLEVLAGELSELGTFTDYTDTDGVWETVKDNGNIIDKTVWTRYVCIQSPCGSPLGFYFYALRGDKPPSFHCSWKALVLLSRADRLEPSSSSVLPLPLS